MKLSIIAPCFNEELNIELFYDELNKVFLKEKYNYEIIFVDDGSKDKTKIKIKNVINKSKDVIVKGISFSRNFGKEAAMLAGLKYATGDYICIVDVDLQQDPLYIKKMLDFLEKNEDYDEVAAYQKNRKDGLFLTFFKNVFYKIINKVSSIEFVSGASDFRMFKKNVVESILLMNEYDRFSRGIFSFVGFNIYYMEYEVKKRKNGKSSWSLKKLFKYALDGITAFTTMPLKIPYILSLLTFISSIIYLIIQLNNNLTSINEIILFILLLLMSILFFIMGVFGSYISKIYIQGKNRPLYIIKDYTSNESGDKK